MTSEVVPHLFAGTDSFIRDFIVCTARLSSAESRDPRGYENLTAYLVNALPYTNSVRRMSTPQIASSKAIYFCFEVYASATPNSAPYRADEQGYLLQQDEWNVVLSFICMQDFRTQRHRSIALQVHVCTIGFMFERADWLSLQICGVRPLHPVRGKMTFRRKQEAYRGYV